MLEWPVLSAWTNSGLAATTEFSRSGNKPLRAVIGGMHLINASPARPARTIEEFRRLGVRLLAPCHCTGMPATVALWTAFPTICVACHVGSTFEFESL